MDDGGEGMARLVRYFQAALTRKGAKCIRLSATHFLVENANEPAFRITTDREAAKEDEQTSLLGLEHPVVKQLLDADRQLEASARALCASQGDNTKGVLTVWHVSLQDAAQRFVQRVIPIGLDCQGKRNKAIEVLLPSLGNFISGNRMHIYDCRANGTRNQRNTGHVASRPRSQRVAFQFRYGGQAAVGVG